MTLYIVDPQEFHCTCPDYKFNGHKRVCKHVHAIVQHGTQETERFHVWKEDKDRWYAAHQQKGFVADSLTTIMNAIGSV